MLVAGYEFDMARSSKTSLRYGGETTDLRSALIRLVARLQGKKVVFLKDNAKICSQILASSDTKGTFLEHLIATPAWAPFYSIESVDGNLWKQLSEDFKKLMSDLSWRETLTPIIQKHLLILQNKKSVVDAEAISRLVVRILFEVVFEQPLSENDEALFYQASLQWRKKIAVKGSADRKLQRQFIERLTEHIHASRFKDGLKYYEKDEYLFLSLFAQPLILSPQINVSDVFVTVFNQLRSSPLRMNQAKDWAKKNDKKLLEGIILESIRLRHPFPILERELKNDLTLNGISYKSGTQFIIYLDQFSQSQDFQPERWLKNASENPYHALPFATGARTCAGKFIAMELMSELLKGFVLYFNEDQVQPKQGHLFSGRDNDHEETFFETLYQLKVFSGALLKSFLMGLIKRKPHSSSACIEPAVKCPWSRMTMRLKQNSAD